MDQLPQSKVLIQRWVAVLMVIMVVLLAFSFNSRLATIRQMRQDEARLKQAVVAEEAKQSSLKSLRSYVASDAYTEHWARVEAKMTRPGEVAIVPMALNVAPVASNAATLVRTPATILDEWWTLFFGETSSTP